MAPCIPRRLERRALGGLALGGLAALVWPRLAGAQAPPGAPAPAPLRRELQQTLATAIERFQALDAAGVLAHVSEQYRNGPFTKRSIREHLLTMFALYDVVRAQVRVVDVRLVDGAAWVYTSGEISGRLRALGAWTSALVWEREPDVARRENGTWRLVGPGP